MANTAFDSLMNTTNVLSQARERRERSRVLKDESDLRIAKAGFTKDETGNLVARPNSNQDVQEQENALIKQQLNEVRTQLAVRDSDAAMVDYLKTGDANNLQRALSNNKELGDLYRNQGVYQVANIDFENDKAILQRAGIQVEDLDLKTKKDLVKQSMFKYYDGKQWQLGNTESLIARTGILNRASADSVKIINDFTAARVQAAKGLAEEDVNIQRQEDKSKIVNDTTKAKTELIKSQTDAIKENNKSIENARRAEVDNKKLSQKDRELNIKERGLEIKKNSSKVGAPADEFGKLDTKTKQLYRADKSIQNLLDEDFNGDIEQFMSTDFSDKPELRRKAKKIVDDALNLKGRTPTSFIQRQAIDLTKLTNLATRAGNLEKTDLGWFDDTVQQTFKYFSNNPKLLGNIEAKAAFEAYKGLLRVAMIGAAQTPTETRNFNKMLGSMKQQPRAVLTQLKSSIQRLLAEYKIVSDFMGDPMAAKLYVGRDLSSLSNVIGKIDETLSGLSDRINTKPVKRNTAKKFFEPKTKSKGNTRLSAKERLKQIMDAKRNK